MGGGRTRAGLSLDGLTPKEHIDMNVFERQKIWETKNFRINLLLMLFTAVAAVAAWWFATHPNIIVIPQVQSPPAATSSQRVTKSTAP
jgi:hypothetical protein